MSDVAKPIVVVSGLPRSGTSMMMKMLEAGGLPPLADELRTADEDNPKGYYEDQRVKDLAKDPDPSWIGEAQGKVVKVISRLLASLPQTFRYRIVFMRRDLDEVLASQAKMLTRRGGPQADAAGDQVLRKLFERDLLRTEELLRTSPNLEAIDVAYAAVLASPREEAARVAAFLELPLDVDRMVEVVDAALYRNRAPRT
jgi:hypothetical protein